MIPFYRYGFSFALGAILASFLNTLSLQLSHHESPLRKRSHCPHCHTNLKWVELIPLISYGLQKGKCRYCHHGISKRYLYTEIFLSLVGLSLSFLPLSNVQVLLLGWILSTLFYISLRDWDAFVIDDLSLLFLGFLSLLWNQMFPIPLIEIVKALLFCVMLAIIAHKTQAIGSGDIYLLSVASLLLGYQGLMFAFLMGNGLALMHRSYELYTQQKKRSDFIAYASYLSLGISIALIYGRLRI